MKILYPDSISGYPDIRILYPEIRILYPKLVCFGYHFLENLPFSLHYCYVKITIFHPVVSKIKLRFYLKPGNREPMFECWDESGSEHLDWDESGSGHPDSNCDCVIFFQEIESNLRSMEVQFGMNDFS